ncbi:hypothetical protein NUW58_g6412 [Xylaria curta]|uniref:Uncharacterized protein n=1 Tax=Xylaria curta TaxID=42375 RepID=A0ACC1NTC7_9PEZI|nr:hypothetical protein NUW58_g6412 [Xylaria curta]
MTEAAGVALGALPIAILAIQSYHKGLELVEGYKNYQQTLKGIERNLFVQDQLLQATFQSMGLQKPTLPEVQQKLREINPDCADQFLDILDHMGEITARLMEKLEINSNGKPKWTDEWPERVSWEWRRVERSFGNKYRKELYRELHYWNSCLKTCLEPKREILSTYADPLTTEILRGFNPRYCEDARENFRIIHEALAVAWGKNCTCPQHPSNVELIWQQTGLKETGQLQLSLQEVGAYGESKHWQRVSVGLDTKRMDSMSGCNIASNLLLAKMPAPESTPVVKRGKKVQFRDKLEGLLALSRTQGPSLPLNNVGPNQNSLSGAQLVTDLCVLAKQAEWNGRLFHPEATNEHIINIKKVVSPCSRFSSLSLEAVLSDRHFRSGKGKQADYPRLSRKERLGIAAAAVWAVLVLCGTPWLEERWLGKEDITLLVEAPLQGKGFDRPKTYPTLLHTFTSQTQTASQKLRDNSPRSYQEPQIRHKTLFALGILLIELGLNKTLHQLRNDIDSFHQFHTYIEGGEPSGDISAQDAYTVANRVIDSEDIELELGLSYSNAVQRCIRCYIPGSSSKLSFSHVEFRKEFFSGVVAPVQATFDAQITSERFL